MSWTYQQLADLQKRKASGAAPKPARSNVTNTGKAAEKLFAMTAEDYERKGILRLCKSDPPVKFIGGRVVFLENPWLDFCGCWFERGGRMLCIEVKSTVKTRLDLTENQRNSVLRWSLFGAAVCVVWYRFDQCRIAHPGNFNLGNPKWSELECVRPGVGLVVFDWLENLRKRFP